MKKLINTNGTLLSMIFLFAFTACQEFVAHSSDESANFSSENYGEFISQNSKIEPAVIYDQGVRMEAAKITPPVGFQVRSDVSTNVATGDFDRYLIEISNGKGELIVYFGELAYIQMRDLYTGQLQGISMDQICAQLRNQVNGTFLTNVQIGALSPDRAGMQEQEFKQIVQMANQQGFKPTLFVMPVSGHYKGIPVSGKIGFLALDMTHQFQGYYESIGTVSIPYLMVAPQGQFERLEAQAKQLKIDYNPAWTQTRSQIAQRNQQQRMAQNKSSFDAHQRNYQATQDAFKAQNDAWYDRNLGSGSQYNSSASFIDAVTGHTSFNDPYTGHQIKQEGHYNHWFTDGQGQYYGTDNPNVNASDFQGSSWQSIQPVGGNNY